MGDLTIWLIVYLLVFAAVSWRNLRVGVYLILMALPLYLIRFKFGPIPTTLLELMVYVATLVWLIKLVSQTAKVNLAALRIYQWPLLLLIIGLGLGVWVSTDRSLSLGIIKGWFIDPLLLFALMTSVLNRQLHIKQAIAALMVPAGVLSTIAIYQVVNQQFVTVDGRASAVFSSANYLSLFLVPIIILGVSLLTSIAPRWRWWVGLSLSLMIVALYFTFSYAGWLGLLVGLGVWWLCSVRFWVVALSGVGVGVVAILSQWQHPKFQQMLDLAGRSSSHVRLQVWRTAGLMIKEHLWTGIGLGQFEQRYLEFANRLYQPPLELRMLHSHNLVLQFLINTGVIGAVGFGWLVVVFIRGIWQAAVIDRGRLAVAILAAMIALLTHGALDTPYWKNDLSMLFWAILAFGIILGPKVIYDRDGSHYRN